ncbi:uncharacterized protein FIBRA_02908 [Fibroporia radiculosa]|uniref:GPI-anchored wall transfer protein 1 n=1 Tax=Fibroporia radiculosa TaxID=599839 RepID=J4HVP3_9APHY|nr:uncharacterized protein FIBRA_02908 [Fibroporia radiculosa]CCM00862.1 predicted protein [Fibroporia radiculosa]
MGDDYKTSKEAFVSGMTGSSIGHVNMVSLAALSSMALHSALRTRLPQSKSSFLLDLVLLGTPLLLSVTLSAESPSFLNLALLIVTGLVLLLPRRDTGPPLPSTVSSDERSASVQDRTAEETPQIKVPSGPVIAPLPALTTYRSHMLLMTFTCILAVDFPVFPRMLAKCETFGVSLMDLGVGSFVFSQGIVSAIPLIKNPSYLKNPLIPKLVTVLRKCSPLLFLGLIRTLSVKGVEYPEHQTEYGTHWNFFITLAVVPFLQVFLHPLMLRFPISLLGVLVAFLHQLALNAGLRDFVMNAPRVSIISANKEGIVSSIGYLAVDLLGLSVGTLVLPATPSYFRRRQQELIEPLSRPTTPRANDLSDLDSERAKGSTRRGLTETHAKRENDKTAIELCSYAVLYWVLLGALKYVNAGEGISRRLISIQYIIWVAAYNTTFLLGYLVLDLVFFASPFSKSTYSPYSKLKVQPNPLTYIKHDDRKQEVVRSAPALLEAINKNGLVLFLMGAGMWTLPSTFALTSFTYPYKTLLARSSALEHPLYLPLLYQIFDTVTAFFAAAITPTFDDMYNCDRTCVKHCTPAFSPRALFRRLHFRSVDKETMVMVKRKSLRGAAS